MKLAVDATVSAAVEGRLHSLGITIPVFVALFATRSSSGVPQIVQMARSKTPKQVASKWGARVFYGDSLVYLSRIVYHLRRGFPVSCWSELIPLMVQNLACFILLRKTLSDGPDKRRRQLLTVGFDAVVELARDGNARLNSHFVVANGSPGARREAALLVLRKCLPREIPDDIAKAIAAALGP